MNKILLNLPLVLGIVLYLLILLIRYQQGGWNLKWDFFQSLRERVIRQSSRILPSPQAELLSGILLGQNNQFPAPFKLALRDTSTLHIVVASGQNLSMVAGFFLALSGLIKRKNAVLLGLAVAIFYTVLSGMQVPIIRAMLMFGLASSAQFFGRQKDGMWILMMTAALMLLVNPAWIWELSFQLSFLATFGVVVVAPILLQYLKILPVIDQDLAVTIGAQMLVAPFIVQNFHQLSLVSVFANLLVGWTIPFIMISGGLMLVLSLVSTNLATLTGLIAGALLTYFIYVVEFFANLPFAWEYVGEQGWIVWVGYYLVVGGVLMAASKKTIDGR